MTALIYLSDGQLRVVENVDSISYDLNRRVVLNEYGDSPQYFYRGEVLKIEIVQF